MTHISSVRNQQQSDSSQQRSEGIVSDNSDDVVNSDITMRSICSSESVLSPSLSLNQSPCLSSSVASVLSDDSDTLLTEKLKEWSLKHGCTRQCINDMLGIFIDLGHSVPKDSRTLLNSQRKVDTNLIGEGSYVYIGVEKSIRKMLDFSEYCKDSIDLKVNIDGLPLFKSSSLQLWPILVQFGPFQPVGVAFYCGRKKPPVKEFLKDFVLEMDSLTKNGILVDGNEKSITIYCFTCDAPARSLLKGIVQHTGYHSCERCTVKGVSVRNRIVFDKENLSVKRDGETFRRSGYSVEDSFGKRHQLCESALCPLSIDLVSDFALDYMHMVCLGITRRLLYYVKGSYKGIQVGRLSSAYLVELSDQLQQLNGSFPSEFARQPRTLSELDRWKATELRSFLLYSGPVVLRPLVSTKTWKHFLSLSIAIRMLLEEDDTVRCDNIDSARKLLHYFVYNANEHYGETFCVYNVHGLLHLPDDVEHFRAPLNSFSTFQFENHLQRVKRLVRGKGNPIAQIVKRSEELDGNYYVKADSVIKVNSNKRDSCFLTKSGIVFINEIDKQGRLSCEFHRKSSLQSFFECFMDSKELDIYLLKKNSKPVRCYKEKADLVKKCVCIPYKADTVIIAMLQRL